MTSHLTAGPGGGRPLPILLVEKSIGLSGSTISLCALVNHLDRHRFEPHIVVSRPEQADYLRAALHTPTPIDLMGPAQSLRNLTLVRRALAALETRAPRPRRLLLRCLALADLACATVPYAFRLWRLARARRAALLHQNNGFDVAALLAARLHGVPLVCYQRGDEWDSWLVRLLAPRVDQYVANSGATRANLLSLGVASARVAVEYPPIELVEGGARNGSPLSREGFGVSPAAPCFGIVGQLQEWKGQKVFLKAARYVLSALPEARAWVIGDTPAGGEQYRRELGTLAAALGIEDKVIFTGFVSDVSGIIGLLDVVVHASVDPEPFGRVIAEAMMLGKPVVASDAGGPREIVDHGRTGLLVPPGDEVRLAEAIIALLRDRVLARCLAQAGRREARGRFAADRHAEALQRIYQRALEPDLPPSSATSRVGRAHSREVVHEDAGS